MVLTALPANGLVSWYQAEATANDSTGSNHAALVNGATFAAGKVGQAFSFDGIDDYIEAPHSASLSFGEGTPFSIELWAFRTSEAPIQHLLGKRVACDPDDYNYQVVANQGDLPRNAWAHVAHTFDGLTYRIYIDGTLKLEVGGGGGSNVSPANNAALRVGTSGTCQDRGQAFGGLIDELSIYNRALSLAEIQAIIDSDASGKDLLLAWYRAEGNAEDEVNAHDGTLQGNLSFAVGHDGQAFSMDGIDDSVDLGNWFNLQSFTIDMWVKPGATQTAYANIIDNNHTFGINWVVQQDSTTTNRYSFGGRTPEGDVFFNLTANTWQHLALTRDSSGLKQVFLDGQLVGSAQDSPLQYDSNQFLRLGSWGGGGRHWNGLMDEVRIHQRALSQQEIRDTVGETCDAYYCATFDDGEAPPEFSGVTTTASVEGFASHGFAGEFLRNDTAPPNVTVLTLNGLPEHDAINLAFLLAAIDSWDGSPSAPGQFFSPDLFNVVVDGELIFSETLANSLSAGNPQSYVPPPGVELARRKQLGFNPDSSDYLDSAYDMGLDPAFRNIPHTSSTLSVQFFASGSGYEGGLNESWAIDNVKVFLHDEDDPPPPPPTTIQFGAAQYEVVENESFAVLTVERTGGLGSSARVDFETVSGTAGQPRILAGLSRDEDFTTTSGTLFFRPRQNIATIRVPIRDDVKIEPAETFSVVLSNPSAGAVLGASASAQVTILDNDPSLSFVASSSQRNEQASGRLPIEVRLTPATNQKVTVAFSAVAGTATAGVDYRPGGGTLTFNPGETRKFIQFQTIDDSLYEPGNETVTFELNLPRNASIGSQARHRVTIVDNDPEPPPVDPGGTPASALFIDLQTLPRQDYVQTLRSSDRDVFRVHLKAGERLALDVDPASLHPATTGLSSSTLTILKPDGTTVLATVGRSAEPDTGMQTNNPAHMFQAPETGDYYIRLQTTGNAVRGYRLWFHRVGVSENVPDPKRLDQPGPMFVWYDGDKTVGITGPTGYGFTLVGPWQQETNTFRRVNLTTQTLKLPTGSQFTLKSPQGVELPVIATSAISIKTKYQRWGDVVGVVDDEVIKLPAAIDIVPINNVLADAFGAGFATVGLLSAEWRISLGGTVFNSTIPRAGEGCTDVGDDCTEPIDQLQAGVPYLRRFGQSVVDATVGGFRVSQLFQPTPMNWVFDPADPMLYVRIPSGPGLAASKHGLLRFVPTDPPDSAINAGVTEFSGHVYGNVPIPLPGVPVSLGGESGIVALSLGADFVINVDADRDGKPLGDLRDVEDLSDVIRGDFSEVREILRDIQLGANGTLSMSIPVKSKLLQNALKIELGQSSQVLNGPAETLWTRGEHQGKAFQGTPLEIIGSESIVMEGLIDFGGDFFFAQTVTSKAGGVEFSHRYTISNEGITATISGDVEWSATIDYQAGTVSGKAKASFTAQVAIEIDDDGDVHLSGSVSASGKLTARIAGESTTLFSGSIEAKVRSRGLRFRFPRGVGNLDLDLF